MPIPHPPTRRATPDPFPVRTVVEVIDHDGTVMPQAFQVVRSYWPEPVVELIDLDLDRSDSRFGMIRQNHGRMRHATFYVRIDRGDDSLIAPGTRTYRGPMTGDRVLREADAWAEQWPHATVAVLRRAVAEPDMRTWSRAVQGGGRYPTPARVDA